MLDTLYSEPVVDGEIMQINMFLNGDTIKTVSTTGSDIFVGDWYQMVPDGNENWNRGYISFDISGLLDSIQDAVFQIYQFESIGNSTNGIFPTLGNCFIDHIIYGDSLDTLDWTAGNYGNSQTIANQYGVISSTPDIGWRSLDVTACLQADKSAGRNRTQFRLRFPIDTDHDWLNDFLRFYTGNAITDNPRLIVDNVTGVAGSLNVTNSYKPSILEKSYPEPFCRLSAISYVISTSLIVKLEVYNLLGKKVRTLVNGYHTNGKYNTVWDGKNDEKQQLPNGIYLYVLKTQGKQQLHKTTLIN
jgi:hypothetical protein